MKGGDHVRPVYMHALLKYSGGGQSLPFCLLTFFTLILRAILAQQHVVMVIVGAQKMSIAKRNTPLGVSSSSSVRHPQQGVPRSSFLQGGEGGGRAKTYVTSPLSKFKA